MPDQISRAADVVKGNPRSRRQPLLMIGSAKIKIAKSMIVAAIGLV
jgi:hypothetical protein